MSHSTVTQDQRTKTRRPAFSTPGRVTSASLGAAAAAFASTLPVWIRAQVTTVVETRTLEISGADAASAVSALALVALAAALAIRLTGPRLRRLVSLLQVLVGLAIALTALGVYWNPQAAASTQVSAATGTTAAADLYQVTAMPWMAVAAGVLVLASGLWAFLTSSSWQTGRKYDTSQGKKRRLAEVSEPDDIDTWDSLSQGIDPTDR